MNKKENISQADRIILGFAAFVISEVYFSYQDTKAYIKNIHFGRQKRILAIILFLPILIVFLVISYFPSFEKHLRQRLKVTY